jgi:hypothetical protein
LLSAKNNKNDITEETEIATKIERKPVADSEFSIPADFQYKRTASKKKK